tara:strand:+ start:469 stop:642 length:174 start_codon:yes stop_codon:yes gene_type:complete
MIDKIALSVIILFIEGMAQNSEQNTCCRMNGIDETQLPDSVFESGFVRLGVSARAAG